MQSSESDKGIALYAELLSNLRQLSVVASLPSPCDSTTAASLSEDGLFLTVSHKGRSKTLKLPQQPVTSVLQIPAHASTEVSWRLRIPPATGPPQRFTLEDQPLPWNARDILGGSPVTCRGCGQALVNRDCIAEWKDLPSDNWAEMMEFWHCHKPVDHDDPTEGAEQDGTTTQKGYGANNVISAQQGIGLVDATSFVLSRADCSGVSKEAGQVGFTPCIDMVSDTTPPDQAKSPPHLKSGHDSKVITFSPEDGCHFAGRNGLPSFFTPVPRDLGAVG